MRRERGKKRVRERQADRHKKETDRRMDKRKTDIETNTQINKPHRNEKSGKGRNYINKISTKKYVNKIKQNIGGEWKKGQ